MLKNRLSNSSLGLNNILDAPNKCIQSIWISCYFLAWSLCAYFLVKNLESYFEYEVVAQIEYSKESNFSFPAVTFCNKNPFLNMKTEVFSDKEFTEFKNELLSVYINQSNKFLDSKMTMESILSSAVSEIFKNISNIVDHPNETIISCKFNGQDCMKDISLNYNSSFHGICYSFNNINPRFSGNLSLKTTNSEGLFGGLNLELYVPNDESNLNYFPNDGIDLVVHEQVETVPFIHAKTVPTGMATNIVVNKIKNIKLNKPYNECDNYKTINDFDSIAFKKTFEKHHEYKQQ
jgi:hypothetical protein